MPSARCSTFTPRIAPQRRLRGGVGAAGHLVAGRAQLDRRPELVLEPPGGHLELQPADRGQHRGLVAQVGVAQHLHHALLVELGDAPAELLEAARVAHPDRREVLGGEAGMAGVRPPGAPTYSVSPTRTSVALTRPTTSPGKASSTVSRSWPNSEWAYLVENGLPVRPWVTTMPRSKRPEHTRMKATRSRWAGSMLACTLNTKPEKGASSGRRCAVHVLRGPRGRARGRPRRRAACARRSW